MDAKPPIVNQSFQTGERAPVMGKFAALKAFFIANKWYVGAIILGLGIIIVLAYFALKPEHSVPQAAQVELSIDVPDNVPTGSEVIYKIKAENKDRATLVGLTLELNYASGMSYVSSQPNANNLSGTEFTVPNLDPGQNAVIIVKVQAAGDINDQKQLTARLHYHYSNFNSEFIKEASKAIRLIASDVVLEMDGPLNISSGESGTYTITYQNNSDHEINNSRVQLTYPDGFTFSSASPQPDVGNNIWNLGTLPSGQSGTITLQGNFRTAQPGQSLTFSADFLVLDSGGTFFTQASNKFITAIATQPLVVSQVPVEGAENGLVRPGDTVRYKIQYRNNATVVASGVNIVASIDSKAVNPSSIQADGAVVTGTDIIWNASSVKQLERLNPNDQGEVEFSLTVKNPAVKDTSTNLTVKTSVKIKSNEYKDFLTGNDVVLKVASPSSLQTSLQNISGPLPPQVGKTTTYQVTLSLRNATNDYNNAVLTAFIPLGAGSFDLKSVTAKEASKVNFDPSTGKLTWQVGTLSSHTGDFNPLRKLQFNVKLTPSQSQVGQEVVLVKNISFSARDTFTAQDITLSSDQITTRDIPNQDGGGTVVP